MDLTKLNKALRICAGPGCGDECPYYGETKGGKTCRAWLLNDAEIALAAKNAENAALAEEVNRIAAELDKLTVENEELRKEREMSKREGETDRKSVCDEALVEKVSKLIAQAKYQEGRADALEEIVARCSLGGGCRHE